MWCEMVDWLNPKAAVKSQTQIAASELDRHATILSRVGSASAFSSSLVSKAQPPSAGTVTSQHTPR